VDFAHYYPGVEISALWRRRRWRRLLNLIVHLPAASHYAEAQANDEALIRRHLSKQRGPVEYRPRVSDWSPVVAELANLNDRVGELIMLQIASNGHPPPRLRPRPRPRTALERIRAELLEEQHTKLVDRLLPNRSTSEEDGR
jgi:hypothetical protein